MTTEEKIAELETSCKAKTEEIAELETSCKANLTIYICILIRQDTL